MENKRYILIGVLILLISFTLNTCLKKENKTADQQTTLPVAVESKVEAIPLEQNQRSAFSTPSWKKNNDPWYNQTAKKARPAKPGDEENPKGVLSLM